MGEQGLPSLASPSRTRRWAGLACLPLTFALAAPVHALDPQKSITQFTHTAWSAKDGIPGPVRAMAQTQDGYLWLGTEAGLYRFDGLRFTPYEPSRGAHLHGPAVLSLLAARDGSLWMGLGSGGVGRLRDGQVAYFPPGEGVPAGGILSLADDGAGSIWAAGQYGFARFESGKWRRVGMEMGYAAPGAQALLVDRAGTLWVATDGFNFGLSKDPVRANTILSLARNATGFSPTGEAVGMIWSMAEAPDGAVWVADTSFENARPIDPGGGASRGIALDQAPMCLIFGSDRSLWIGLIERGLRRALDVGGDAPLEQYRVEHELSGSVVYATLKDREGNLWFGTGGGLDRFRENKVTAFSESEGLVPDQKIALTSTPDGSVWLISYTRDTVRRFRDGAFVGTTLAPYSSSDSSRILALYANPTGQVWVGGSFKLARESHGTFSYLDIPDVIGPSSVEAVAEDKAGALWVTLSTPSGIGPILRRRGAGWTDLRAQTVLPPYRCRVLHADAVGRMWLGFENGELVVFEGDTSRLYSTKDGLQSGRVLVIAEDRAGHVWIGGEGGLSQFGQDRFVTLTQDNGLPGSSVSGIVADDDGNLWLAGALGILRVTPQELEKALASASYRVEGVTFDATDGLRGLPRQREPFPTATRAADGRLWFATTGGIAVIDPHQWPRNAMAPPVRIERVTADDRILESSGGLRLPPNTKRLELHYVALCLTAPERVRFRYKLEGYDADWRGPVSARNATYTNLPPRDYRFHVIASNNDGVWNEAGAMLDFSIAPSWYQTAWFRFLSVVCGLGTVWALYDLRVRQIKRSQEAEEHAQAAMADLSRVASLGEMAAAIAHEVNQPLAAISMNASTSLRYLRQEQLDVEEAKSAVSRIARDVARATDVVKRLRDLFTKSGGTKAPVNMNEAIHEVVALTRSQVQRNGAALRTDLCDEIPLVMGDRVQLQQVMVNLVVNAAEAMKDVQDRPRDILVRTLRESDRVRVEVRDVGMGVAPGQRERIFSPFHTTKPGGMGMGLSICKTIVESHGGKLCVLSNSGPGSTFHFSLPVSRPS